MTKMPVPSAWRVLAVSISDSPLATLLAAAVTLVMSAPSRRPASSNETRVRVLFS
jgi:hypothetical protein